MAGDEEGNLCADRKIHRTASLRPCRSLPSPRLQVFDAPASIAALAWTPACTTGARPLVCCSVWPDATPSPSSRAGDDEAEGSSRRSASKAPAGSPVVCRRLCVPGSGHCVVLVQVRCIAVKLERVHGRRWAWAAKHLEKEAGADDFTFYETAKYEPLAEVPSLANSRMCIFFLMLARRSSVVTTGMIQLHTCHLACYAFFFHTFSVFSICGRNWYTFSFI